MRQFALLLALCLVSGSGTPAAERPNIVLIYTDDLGYGDLSAYGATTVKTPNIDSLARRGVRFTDAHSAAATCTPSRYALLTGEYAWRHPGTGVLPGNAALIIEPGRTTLASMLQRAGYTTGIVGKWHLGLGAVGGPDWNGEIAPGPNEVGFQYAFVMPATADRVPTVFVENHHVVGLDVSDPIKVSYDEPVGDWPTGRAHPELLKVQPSHGHDQTIINGIGRIGYMTGGRAALWKDEEMALTFTSRAINFIEQQRSAPFFLYFAPHDPHVPRAPNLRFVGATRMGPRGDAIVQADWSVGEILRTLERLHLDDNTLVIFTSDNGPVIDDGYQDEAVTKLGRHRPSGPFRGGKYSNFEAGTRVPMIVSWPRHVKHGVSDALVSQVDLLASLAAFTQQRLAAADAPDSEKLWPALIGRSSSGRSAYVEQGSGLSLRQGKWKYIEASDRSRMNVDTNTELGNDGVAQLYDLSKDPSEQSNVASKFPDKVTEMQVLLDRLQAAGRSRGPD
jgi:arylsulfatase A-like enzyme